MTYTGPESGVVQL